MTTAQIVSFVLLWIVIGAEGVLLFLLYQHMGLTTARRRGGLAVGTQAPTLVARDAERALSLAELLIADYNLFVFGSATCSGCRVLLMDRSVREYLATQSMPSYFLNYSNGVERSVRQAGGSIPSLDMLTVDKESFKDYAITNTPFAYVLSRAGVVVARGAVEDPQRLKELCHQANRPHHNTARPSLPMHQHQWTP